MAERTAEPDDGAAPDAAEALGWSGWRIDEIGGAGVGRVEGVYVDSESGEGAWLLARMGRFGHRSLLPFADAAGAAGRVWVPYERSLIRAAPRAEPGSELTREDELELCAHFGIPDSVGRAAAVAARAPGVVTARPAD